MNFRSMRYALLAAVVLLSACRIPELIANAGPDQVVSEGAGVTLKPSANILDYIVNHKWTQTAGPTVKFKVSKKGVLTFIAPQTEVQQVLTFKLVVMYERGHKSKADTVNVTVNQIKFFGTATAAAADYDNFLTYFDQVTPENAGKWGSVEGTRDVMNWQGVDDAYNFAMNNGLPFKFHTLVWGQQQPGWMTGLSTTEQLEEITEWMDAVAARYPDLDMIDVVNEPLNAPAGYRDALGGAGETGYDWVITAFEMARERWPHATLILNEYNTLILEQFTTNYLVIIDLLQERGLIDGIGEQAHFLERADVPVVAANLDALAATGLPIYISEFDLNYADDARQANVMRDLFTVFWDHPSVAGVTHWGYREGATWRTDAYLLRADGTERPALTWLTCYMGGGTNCPVPDYVPTGWQGTEFGVTLEAELYDEGEGVAALGNIVAYTDDGDWIAFKGVEFQQGWDTFWVNYSKGNDAPSSISVYLDNPPPTDDPPSTAVFTLELPFSGGWNSADTLEQAWAGVTGTHDVYIRFNGQPGEGVANIDSVRFGKPQPDSGVNLVTNGGFEVDTAGWSNWSNGNLSASNLQAHSGVQSLRSTSRGGVGGYAAYGLTSVVQANTTYAVSAWVLHTGAASDTVRLAAKVECTAATTPPGHNPYPWLQSNSAVAPNTWTQLGGNLVIPAGCTVMDAAIYFEGTATTSDVFIDDVRVVPPDNNLVTDGGFETGIAVASWSSWNGSTLGTSTAQKHSGNQSLAATNRPSNTQFAVYGLTSVVQANTTYAVSAWVLHTGAANDTVVLTAKLSCSGTDDYIQLHNNSAVVPNTWTQLGGNLVIPAGCTVTDAAIYFEGTTAGVDVYLDDVSVQPL